MKTMLPATDLEVTEVDMSAEADAVDELSDMYVELYGMPPNEAYTYALGLMMGVSVGRALGVESN